MKSTPRPGSLSRLIASVLCVGALVLLAAVTSFPTGAPAMRTGAPGDQTCNAFGCHNTFALNSGPGSVQISAPAEYVPGTPVDVTVTVSQAGQIRFGFEITARDGDGDFAGSWTPGENQQFADNNPEYVTHDNAPFEDNQSSFTLTWNAPAAGTGDVTFYAAGNAANGNGFNTGDQIYTTSRTVNESVDTAVELVELPRGLETAPIYPNPVVSRTTLSYRIMRAADVRLTVYDTSGRLVRTVDGGRRAPGEHRLELETAGLPGGVYHYRLETTAGTETGKMLVIR